MSKEYKISVDGVEELFYEWLKEARKPHEYEAHLYETETNYRRYKRSNYRKVTRLNRLRLLITEAMLEKERE